MDALTFLRDHTPLFAGVPEDQLTPLAVSSAVEQFKNGQTIMFKGTTVDGLHVMCAGSAGVWVKTPKGVVQVAELGAGDVFGETSIFEMGTAGATIKSAADGTVVLTIPQDSFRGLLAGNPEFVARVQALIAARKA
ncbi:MAG: cyclic nucleotide-binding domain-containing protein [Elusimicrobiota bacterium]|nr:MAG: cyclic nucleotide-binding domain-containing protein [Elusimicrobiota bacterium]